jgi:protein-S-isoprenylcysteine O-methyltransferase Ste14
VPAYAYVLLVVGWLAWATPFLLVGSSGKRPQQVDRRARWGIALQVLGYALLWQGPFWTRSPTPWRVAAGVLFLALAGVLSWTGRLALGPQWRLDAGLDPDHELVQAGAYRFVRHPIYASMLCLMLGTGFLITSPVTLFLPAVLLLVIGMEIRLRIEDGLLAARFADRFEEYRRRVAAYVPFLR